MREHRTDFRHQAGFTLIEMVVTVLIAAILMTMAVPAFTRLITSSRLADQTNELIYAMTFTRSEAIRRNVPLTFCRAAGNTADDCATATGPWEFWIVRNPAGVVLRRGLFSTHGGSMSVTSIALTDNSVVFGTDGLARTGGNLINNTGADPTNNVNAQAFRVCSTAESNDNQRRLVLGAGSRITTTKVSGTC